MRNLLVCAAVESELEALPPPSRPDDRVEVEGCLVHAAAVGVGPVEAALGTAALLREPFDAAILVGTCGAFAGSGLAIGAVSLVERALLTSSDAAAGLAYVPAPAAGACLADPRLVEEIRTRLGLAPATCATVVAITKDGDRAAALAAEADAAVEHMEAYGFLRAAARAGVPAACLLGVANEVGPEGHEQWKRHAATAGAAAIEALRALLRSLR
ncbi:MAG TPA: phosphorylase [Vulgatibacter sp.]|nr:phosphorylase [Vulgatibacter sp.]